MGGGRSPAAAAQVTSSLLAGLLLVVGVGAAWVTARAVRRWVSPGQPERLVSATVDLALTILVLVLTSQVLLALSIFSRWASVVLLVVVASASRLLAEKGAGSEIEAPTVSARLSGGPPFPVAGVVLGIAMALGGLGIVLAILHPTTDFDTLQYHLPNAASCVRDGTLWRLPPSEPPAFTNAYPSNGELLGAWVMLQSGSSALSLLEPLPFISLAVLGTALAGRKLGGSAERGAALGICVLTVPILMPAFNSVLTDAAGSAGIVAALALLLCEQRVAGTKGVLLAGLVAGLSVGSKDTALVPAVLLLVGVTVAARGDRLRAGGAFLGGMLIPSILWYLRDLVLLGNPIYPGGVTVTGRTVLQGATGSLTHYRTTMLTHLLHLDAAPLRTWAKACLTDVGPVLLVTFAAAVFTIVRWRRVEGRRRLVAAFVILATLAYLATPYTGGGPGGNATLITAQLRYDLPGLLCGAGVLAACRPRWALDVVALGCGVFALVQLDRLDLGFDHSHAVTGLLVLAGLAGALIGATPIRERVLPRIDQMRAFTQRQGRPARRMALAAAAVLVVLVAGAGVRLSATHASAAAPNLALLGPAHSNPVLLVGVDDVAAVLGTDLRHRIVTLRGTGRSHEDVEDEQAALSEAFVREDPVALVINDPSIIVPSPWRARGLLRRPDGSPVGEVFTLPTS